MRLRIAALAVIAVAASGDTAHAHDFVAGAGILNGILHPLLVPAHALCLLAFGLMAGQRSEADRALSILSFVAALIFGIVLIVSALSLKNSALTLLLACGAIAGLLTALALPTPRVVPVLILAGAGIALVLDSVPSVVSARDTLLALAGTAISATLVLGLVAYSTANLTRDWQRIGVRILGSWTAASAILVLALRLAK